MFAKLTELLLSAMPGSFLDVLEALRPSLPEIAILKGCQQSPEHHPEGDVFIHTAMALDVAAGMRTGDFAHDTTLMFAVLCHDFGKPATATMDHGKWSHRMHDIAGIDIAAGFLTRIGAPERLVIQVKELTKLHLAPFQIPEDARDEAYRKVIRKLIEAGTTADMLGKVSKADKWGRTTEEAYHRLAPDVDRFLAKAKAFEAEDAKEAPVVEGRHLIAMGMKPGKEFGEILKKCRTVQEERGIKDAEEILKIVLVK
jgi:tRNA nucleotidyltransferase (CCA-adding enzyme)